MSFTYNKIAGIGVLLCGAAAAAAQGLPQSVVQCQAVENDIARLECFDREVARLAPAEKTVAPTQVPSVQSAPQIPSVASTQQEEVTPKDDDFGVSGELARKRTASEKRTPKEPRELRAAVTKVTKKASGEFVVTLDNGQVWEQPEKKSTFLIKEGENIRITQGAMGSYFVISDSGATSRVRRVR